MPVEDRRRLLRERALRHKFGITLAEYEALAAAQGGVCAICHSPPQGHRRHLDVDHDHTTSEVRGLLCSPCNRAIGYLRDDPDLLRAAAAYLERVG